MAVTYGTNIVVNGGAETYAGTADGVAVITPTGWTANGDPTVDPWTDVSAFSAAIPKPANVGNVLFTGGPDQGETDLFQTIDLSNIAADVDAGKVSYALSALLGGFATQGDNASVFVNFQGADHSFVDQAFVGPVTNADRNNNNGLLPRSATATVPAGTRFAQVQIHFERLAGTYNDGYADNVSLVLTGPAGAPALTAAAYDVNSHSATFTFDQPIATSTVAASDLEIDNLTAATIAHTATSVSLSADLKSVTFVVPTTLADGNYRLRIATGTIAGTNTVATAANADLATFMLGGDINRDKAVDFNDLLILAKNYNKTGQTFSQGNLDYSSTGAVDFNDLLLLAKHYNATLPAVGSAVDVTPTRHREVSDVL